MFAQFKRPKINTQNKTMDMENSTSGVVSDAQASVHVTLHPLVIMNISDHYTRIKAQLGETNPNVFGALLGKQNGRNLELFNSFELQHTTLTPGVNKIEMPYFHSKEEQFRQVFKDLDFLGWYTVGPAAPSENDISIHKQMIVINESSLLLKLDPLSKSSHLPITIYESMIDILNEQSRISFIEVDYSLASEEAERIGVDHVARLSSAGNSDVSQVSEHIQVSKSAVQMLLSRIQTILDYTKAVQKGEIPLDQEIMRECLSLCQRLPVLNTDAFKDDFIRQCNDVSIMTYLGALTKGCNISNELINKFNIIPDRHGGAKRLRFVTGIRFLRGLKIFTAGILKSYSTFICLLYKFVARFLKINVGQKKKMSLSKLQSPITTTWLHDNYEIVEGVSLPRSSLYTHYLDFCENSNVSPVNAASFGKIIRCTFPDLKTRRLGTRGKSKYHYFGIGVKKTSLYYDKAVNLSGVNNNVTSPREDENEEMEKENTTVSETICAVEPTPVLNAVLLPPFPNVETIPGIEEIRLNKITTFLIMYRAHCQRILDTVLRANFVEVQTFLTHFWQGMPQHIAVILSDAHVIELIKTCDIILYKGINSVLIPTSLQPLPSTLTQAIQHFAKQLPFWIQTALYHLPVELQVKKLSVAKSFSQSLYRQTSLSHLAQASRTVLHNIDHVTQMAEDMTEITSEEVCKHTAFVSYGTKRRDITLVEKFFHEFEDLFERHASIEEYTNWISSVVARCVIKPSERGVDCFQVLAQEFLLKWTYVTSKIIQDLTLKSAKSFGSFHLVQMFFDEYIFYMIESQSDLELDEPPTSENDLPPRNRPRWPSTSSSGRGSLTPPTEDSVFNFPASHQSFTPIFNDVPTRIVPEENVYAQVNPAVFVSANQDGDQSETYYSDDIRIAEELQQRTKLLMDATRYGY